MIKDRDGCPPGRPPLAQLALPESKAHTRKLHDNVYMLGRDIQQYIRNHVHRLQLFTIPDSVFDLDSLEYIDPDLDLGKNKIVNIEASNIRRQQPDTAHLPEIE